MRSTTISSLIRKLVYSLLQGYLIIATVFGAGYLWAERLQGGSGLLLFNSSRAFIFYILLPLAFLLCSALMLARQIVRRQAAPAGPLLCLLGYLVYTAVLGLMPYLLQAPCG